MALLGSSVDPRLFVQDYSGFTRAADIQSQSMQNLGQQIAGGIEEVGDYFKQQGEKKKLIKKSDIQIDAALKLFPDLAPTLQGVRDQIKDENISLDERAGIAESVAGLINMGTNQMQSMAEFGLQKRQLDIQEGRAIQEALMKQAEMQSSKWQSYDKEIVIDGQKVRVTGSLDQFGQFKDIKNNVYPSVADALDPAGQAETPLADGAYPDGVPTDGTPMDGPGVLPLDKQNKVPEPPINFDFNQSPSVPGDTKVAPEVVANIEAAGGVPVAKQPAFRLPPGASIVEEKPSEKQETRMTADQVQNLVIQGFRVNARPIGGGDFMVSGADIGGQAGETIETTSEGGVKITRGGASAKAEAVKEAQKEQSFERSRGIIGAAADSINMIKSDLSQNPVIAKAQQGLSIVLPASTEGRIAKNLETVKILNSKEAVNQARAASPTGSAGGNITENEWKIFQNNFGTLEVGMYPPDLASNLQKTSLNQFEAVNGRPEDVIKLFNNGKITKPVFDEYLKEYKQARKILGIPDTGTGGPGDDWTKYNPNLLRFDKEKQSQLSPQAQAMQEEIDLLKANK